MRRPKVPLATAIALLLAPLAASAAAVAPLGTDWQNAGTGSWFTDANWTNGVPTSSRTATVTNGGTSQVDSGGTGSSNLLTIGGGSTVQVTNGSTLSNTTGAQIDVGTLSVSNGTLTGNVAFTSSDGVLNFSTTTTYGQNVSGTGQITVTAGFVTLGGTNTHTGGVALSGFSTLQVSSDANLGAASAVLSMSNSPTLKYFASFNSSRKITLNSGTGFFDTNGFDSTLSGVISGAGGLDKVGNGTLTLTGRNTFQGGASIEGGTLVISSDANLGAASGQLNINNNATLRLAGSIVSARNGFFQGGGIIDTNGFSATLNGNFRSEGGALTKIGRGTLTLNGQESYGDTFVDEGTLILNGKTDFNVTVGQTEKTIQNAQTRHAAAAVVPPIFGGVGIVGGNLFNAGVVNPGHSPGTLTVNGNYTQASNGTLQIELAGYNPGQFDLLRVGGGANLAGTVRFTSLNGFVPSSGARFVFLTAAGGVTGTFATSLFDLPLYRGVVQYDPNDVAVVFARRNLATIFSGPGAPAQPPLTPNQKAVAKSIDRDPTDPRLDVLFSRLNDFGLAGLPHALDLLAPEELSVIYEIGIGTADVQTYNLDRHLSDLREGRTGFSAERLTLSSRDGKTYEDPKAGAAKDCFTPDPENRWSTFISGSGDFIDIGGDYNARGYDITTGGFTIGVDYRVTPGLALGVLVGYASTGADLTEGGRVDVNSGKFGVYAAGFSHGCYLNAAVTGGYNSYDIKRRGFLDYARGETDGGEINTLLTTGHDFHAGAWVFGPVGELQYTWVGYGGFREQGTLAPLNILGNESDSLRSRVGARVSTAFGSPEFRLKPELRVLWQHEYLDQTRPTDAQFASGAGETFRVLGPQIGRDSLIVNASVTLLHNVRWSTYLAYDGQLARDRYTSHAVSGGVQLTF